MKTNQIHTAFNRRRSRVFLLYALLSGFALVSPALYAQTYLGMGQLGTLPSDLQIALTPMGTPDRIRLSIDNPYKSVMQIQVQDQKGYLFYEKFKRADQLIVPLNFSSAPPGIYTITVATSTARQSQSIVVEPPAPKRVNLYPDRPGPEWVVTSDVKFRHKQ